MKHVVIVVKVIRKCILAKKSQHSTPARMKSERHIHVDVLETIRANCRLGTRARVLLHVATNVEVGQ